MAPATRDLPVEPDKARGGDPLGHSGPSGPIAREDPALEEVRAELRRLGYLGHGFERLLLQDALKPRPALRTLLALTGRVAGLAGLALAMVLAFALGAANGSLTASPLDLPVLVAHLFPPLAVGLAVVFLALSGLVLSVLRLYHVRRIETLSLAAAVVAGAAALGLALWRGRELVVGAPAWELALLGVAAPAVVYLLVKLIYNALLALSIRLTAAAPGRRLFSRRWLGLAILSAAFLLTLPAVLAARRPRIPPPVALPTAPGERVLLLGIDGVLPQEVDYLLAAGDLPTLAQLRDSGGALLRYRRSPEAPASFWTTIATGRPTPEHGVAALDSFRPLGVTTPLARNGPIRAWWSAVEVPLGLAEHRPVLANRRSAYAFWELASRGGAPVLAVDWWATFPAEPLPGLVVAHGAYQLLAEGAEGVVAPAAFRPTLAGLRKEVVAGPAALDPRLAAAVAAGGGEALLDRSLRPDRLYRRLFADRLATAPRAAALYLPGLDIAADGWRGGDVAFADLVRAELQEADRLLAGGLAGVGTVVVVLDPGRRGAGGAVPAADAADFAEGRAEGRVILWRRSGCTAPGGVETSIAPEAVAAGLLRALGLPQSEELPAPPAVCRWPAPPATLSGYGVPQERRAGGREGGEYLESLRSLGYL